MQHMCKTQYKSATDPEGTLQSTPTTNGIHHHGLNRFSPPFKQRKKMCTHGSVHADRIHFLHPNKIQESRGCNESIHR